MFETVLIANRGEIACRVIRTLKRLGIRSVAVFSEADRHARHVLDADVAVCVGPAAAKQSYLNADAVLQAARQTGARAVHPGYGFLSENTKFAEAAEAHGIAFIGPTSEQISKFGLKHTARALAKAAGVPLLPGSELLASLEEAQHEAERIGFPVMLKSSAGGGGIGMSLCRSPSELSAAFETVRRLSQNNFGDASVYLERFVERARHIEVQLFGDGRGDVIALGERDCSAQRRNQKVIEETPAPAIARTELDAMADKVAAMVRGIGYDNIGTVEMLYGADGSFSFLEMNTRLQVEHGVTEAVTGVDLVHAQIRSAAGERLADILPGKIALSGHAIQARIYAEDPKNFFPSPGRLKVFRLPEDKSIRVETGYAEGRDVTPFYDPMIAKVIVHEATRERAIERLIEALKAVDIQGVKHNVPAVLTVLDSGSFRDGEVHTGLIPQVVSQKKAP